MSSADLNSLCVCFLALLMLSVSINALKHSMEDDSSCGIAFLAREMVVVSLAIDILPQQCFLLGSGIRPQESFLLFTRDNDVIESLTCEAKRGNCSSD